MAIQRRDQHLSRTKTRSTPFTNKDETDTFLEHLNKQNPHIQFTKEIEENGKIPFQDCLVSCDDNKLQTTSYIKLTHTDRLLN